ncbi:MAG TPA: hypothetical protein PLS55_11880, partial [Thermogutta sp.]|nr:hypothetical protein [Thermogutta sp.]
FRKVQTVLSKIKPVLVRHCRLSSSRSTWSAQITITLPDTATTRPDQPWGRVAIAQVTPCPKENGQP